MQIVGMSYPNLSETAPGDPRGLFPQIIARREDGTYSLVTSDGRVLLEGVSRQEVFQHGASAGRRCVDLAGHVRAVDMEQSQAARLMDLGCDADMNPDDVLSSAMPCGVVERALVQGAMEDSGVQSTIVQLTSQPTDMQVQELIDAAKSRGAEQWPTRMQVQFQSVANVVKAGSGSIASTLTKLIGA